MPDQPVVNSTEQRIDGTKTPMSHVVTYPHRVLSWAHADEGFGTAVLKALREQINPTSKGANQ